MQSDQQTPDAGATTSDGTSGSTNSTGTSGADGTTSGTRNSKQHPPMSDSTRAVRAAIRALRLRLDNVGRRMTELSYDNQTLMNRLTFLRCENAKLHQALDKERAKLRTFLHSGSAAVIGVDAGASASGGAPGVAASGGSPADASSSCTAALLPAVGLGSLTAASTADAAASTLVEQESLPLPTAQRGRSSLLVDAMTPSSSSTSLDTIPISPRRLSTPPPLLPLSPHQQQPAVSVVSMPPPPPPPLPPALFSTPSAPVLCLNRATQSTASLQGAYEGPFFLFTDIFEDGSSEESTSVSALRTRNAASSETLPSTSTAVKQVSSDTAVARCDAPATASSTTQDDPQAPGTSQNPVESKRTKPGTTETEREGTRPQDTEDI